MKPKKKDGLDQNQMNNLDKEKLNRKMNDKKNEIELVIIVSILLLCVLLGVIGMVGRLNQGDTFDDIIGMLQLEVSADEDENMKNTTTNGYFVVKGGVEGTDYIYAKQALIVQTPTPLSISTKGELTGEEQIRIQVENGIADLTFDSVKINTSKIDNSYAVLVSNGGLHLTYTGENEIASGAFKAGIQSDSFPLILTAQNEEASLTVTGGYSAAGIGSGDGNVAGVITINGGNIRAVGGNNGAGIGAGSGGSAQSITIQNADIKVSGGYGGAGIGGGNAGESGSGDVESIEIMESTVTALGGSSAAGIGGGFKGSISHIHIVDSEIQAVSDAYGAGIGGGNSGKGYGISIVNSNITAIGGEFGAGIGGGYLSIGEDIHITSSEISASGGKYGAGIGGGFQGSAENIIIDTNSSIYAWAGEKAAGIGSGNNMSNEDGTVVAFVASAIDISIKDSFVYAVGGSDGAGIGGGNLSLCQNLIMSGSEIVAVGGAHASGIGGGNYGRANDIEIVQCEIRANAGVWGAGIGGGYSGELDNLYIEASRVYAVGGEDDLYPAAGGAGIGGGDSAGADNIRIVESTVEAISLGYGAGIGAGGRKGSLGQILIDGGSVKATGANSIGDGLNQTVIPIDSNGKNVYPIVLELGNVVEPQKIEQLMVIYESANEYAYETGEAYTDESGQLYLYLPENVNIQSVKTKDGTYYPYYHEPVIVAEADKQTHSFSQDVSIKELGYILGNEEAVYLSEKQLQQLAENGYLAIMVDDQWNNGTRIKLQGLAMDSQTMFSTGNEQIMKKGIASLYVTLIGKDKVTMRDYVIEFYRQDADFKPKSREELDVVQSDITLIYEIDEKIYLLSEKQVEEATKKGGVTIALSGLIPKNSVILVSALEREGNYLGTKSLSLRDGNGTAKISAQGKKFQISFHVMSCNASLDSLTYVFQGNEYTLSVAEIAQAAGNQGTSIPVISKIFEEETIAFYPVPYDDAAYTVLEKKVTLSQKRKTVLITVYAEDKTFTKNYLIICN